MCQFVKLHTVSPFCPKWGYIINSYTITPMTIDEYKELLLQDELKIGYGIPEDEDLPTQYDDYEDESYVDGLLTDGFVKCENSDMFGEEIFGYSLY